MEDNQQSYNKSEEIVTEGENDIIVNASLLGLDFSMLKYLGQKIEEGKKEIKFNLTIKL
jgi:hypothetical protein